MKYRDSRDDFEPSAAELAQAADAEDAFLRKEAATLLKEQEKHVQELKAELIADAKADGYTDSEINANIEKWVNERIESEINAYIAHRERLSE